MIGGQQIERDQQIEIPYGLGALAGRVVYDERRGYFKLVARGGYWVVLKRGNVACLVS